MFSFNIASFCLPREQSICASSSFLVQIYKTVKSVFSDSENSLVSKISTIFQTSVIARIFLKVVTKSKLHCSRNLQTSEFSQLLSAYIVFLNIQKHWLSQLVQRVYSSGLQQFTKLLLLVLNSKNSIKRELA
ncbi:Hypothetical_protein [Hexamita inflata]|uniref:Hypothetical_protein n=1 Tax=Hexamita inflata TaxID=28002 RepID=A0AA86U1F5_9EUKA|nr:Hypothetical protein HINF_LOCUS25980 [Hexamita inflata]